jgi:protein involved in polysaccharide export with SLBB domain
MWCAVSVLLTTVAVHAQTPATKSPELMAAAPALRSAASPTIPGSPASGVLSPGAVPAASTAPVIHADLDDRHVIRAGDKLSFRIDEDKEEPKVLAVTDSGEIELPYNLGRFMAANKTCRTLAQEIKTTVEKDYYHTASVHLGIDTVNAVRGKVYVQGQVTKPGPVTMPADTALRLSQALLLAGPPTQWAKLKEVRVVRNVGKEAKVFIVNAEEFNNGRMENDIVLEPEDWVIVGERGLKF